MLFDYLNQTAQLQRRVCTNEYNEPKYSAPITIRCRCEKKLSYVRKSENEAYTGTTTYYTNHRVNESDLIDGKTVVAVEDMVWFDGTVEGYKVMT